jgi:uncharacterized protein YcgI (DUF1989 family)
VKIISESIINSNTGATFVVKKGQIIRVIGHSTADYTVFNLHNVKERSIRRAPKSIRAKST